MFGYLVTFLVGVATGAAGAYFGNKFTDQRRAKESRRQARREFADVKSQMPELIDEMKADLSKPDNQGVRDFFIVSNQATLNLPHRIFCYYFEDHPNLEGKIAILENHGYVVDITTGNTKKFRMQEAFVEHVLNA